MPLTLEKMPPFEIFGSAMLFSAGGTFRVSLYMVWETSSSLKAVKQVHIDNWPCLPKLRQEEVNVLHLLDLVHE